MPELPEVETIRRSLADSILGLQLLSVKLLSPKSAKTNATFFVNSLVGAKCININRYGKLLAFNFTTGNSLRDGKNSFYLLVHLKMTGQLILASKKHNLVGGHSLSDASFLESVGGTLPNKHTRAIFKFKNGAILFFNDLRKFGYLKIVSQDELNKIIETNYGPEPLAKEFSVVYLEGILKNRKSNIKVLLLNQKLIAGLGNIYVDESLFLAKIRPDRVAASLNKKEIKLLVEKINTVIYQAIEKKGTTFSNYVGLDGKKGNFSSFLKVYGRGNLACYNCGSLIQKIKLAGRGTHFCSMCQK